MVHRPRISEGFVELKLLVTGITGKVGSNFLPAFLAEGRFAGWPIRAICNNRTLDHPAVEVVRASLSDATAVHAAMEGVTHVLKNLLAEVDLTLALSGHTRPSELSRDVLTRS